MARTVGAADKDEDTSESHSQRPTPVTSPRASDRDDISTPSNNSSSNNSDPLSSITSPRGGGGGTSTVGEDVDSGSGTLVELTPLSYSERELELLQSAFALLVQRRPQSIAQLFAQVRKGDHDGLAACLVHVSLGVRDATLPLLQHFIRDEFAARAHDGTVMRENALASKLVKAYLARVGTDYLVETLGKLVQGLAAGKDELEIDTARTVDVEEAARNLPKLKKKVQELLERLCDQESVARLPPGLRLVAQYTAAQAREWLPEAEQQQFVMVGAIIFLRYINPAIATPEMVRGLLKEGKAGSKHALAPRARRNLVLVTKLLQSLSNGTLFGSKEGYMVPLNDFLLEQKDRIRAFFHSVLDYQCNPALVHAAVPSERLSPDALDLQRLHALLFTQREALVSQLSSADALELEQLLAQLGSYQHKLSFAFLAAQDQAHVSRVLEQRAEEAVYVGAANATVLGEKKARQLVLIVGRYTLLLLKRDSGRVYCETHFLDLVRVTLTVDLTSTSGTGSGSGVVTLVFYARLSDKAPGPLNVVGMPTASAAPGSYAGAALAGRASKSEPLTLALQCSSAEHATQIALAIRRVYRASFSGVPAHQRLELRGLEGVEQHLEGGGGGAALSACGGVVDTYRALCVYYEVSAREELAWDLAHLYARSRTLDFDRFTTLREGSGALSDRDALPLLHALAYNSYFVRVELRALKLERSTLQGLVQLVAHNLTLRALTLRALTLRDHSSSSQWGLFLVFDAMRESSALALTELECAQCELTPKDLQQLASYLAQATSHFVRLDLSALCTSSHQEKERAEAMRALLWALANNAMAMRYLQELNLAGNRLEGLEGELAKVLAKRGDALQRLDLSDSRLRLVKLPLPRASLEQGTLRVLSFAQQRLTQDALPSELLAWLGSPSCTLEQLDLSATQLPIDSVLPIVRVLNPRLRLELNLAQNSYARDSAMSLAHALTQSSNSSALVSLDLSDNQLGDEGVQQLAEALYHHRALTRLNLTRTFRNATPKARRDCVSALAQMLTASALPLATLNISCLAVTSSKDKEARLKDALVPLLLALGQARRLTSLDVSGHAFGDQGLIALGKALETTRSLRRLMCDDSAGSLVGLKALVAALSVNRTLTELPLPLLDVTRLMSSEDADKVLATVATLEDRLRRNQRL